MAAISGSALYLGWIYSGGTVNLATDFRNFNWTPTLAFIDSTAGADTFREYISGIGEPGDFSAECVYQSGGTATWNYLGQGTAGTVLYGPEGSAAGKPKYTIPATSKGPQYAQPYSDVITVTAQWQQTSAHTAGTF